LVAISKKDEYAAALRRKPTRIRIHAQIAPPARRAPPGQGSRAQSQQNKREAFFRYERWNLCDP
jgi:hypothetical protein